MLNIGILQYDIVWEDKVSNKEIINNLIDNAENLSTIDWLILPEYSLSGFSYSKRNSKLTINDIKYFKHIARKYKKFITFSGIRNIQNVSITINPKGKIVAEYAKIHLFSYAGENNYYNEGKKVLRYRINDYFVTPYICYDLRFTYLFWNNAFETDVFTVQANWPTLRREHWITLLKARAIENQAYIVGVNRIGKDPNVSYSGDSMVVNPDGEVILDCCDKQGLFPVEITNRLIRRRRKKYKFLDDRKNFHFPILEGINDKNDLKRKKNQLLTIKELQSYFCTSRTKLWEITRTNHIASLKIGGDVRYRVADVMEYLDKTRRDIENQSKYKTIEIDEKKIKFKYKYQSKYKVKNNSKNITDNKDNQTKTNTEKPKTDNKNSQTKTNTENPKTDNKNSQTKTNTENPKTDNKNSQTKTNTENTKTDNKNSQTKTNTENTKTDNKNSQTKTDTENPKTDNKDNQIKTNMENTNLKENIL